MNTLRNFFREEEGQDLVEYTLLLAFVALAAAAILMSASNSIETIWTSAQTQLEQAASSVP
ncbi:MAG: Flp family type IVb pilin [bacterium]